MHVQVRLIPAPRGAGIVAARVPKKVLQMAGIEDCYTASRGSTKTLGNFVKVGWCPSAVALAASQDAVPPVVADFWGLGRQSQRLLHSADGQARPIAASILWVWDQ